MPAYKISSKTSAQISRWRVLPTRDTGKKRGAWCWRFLIHTPQMSLDEKWKFSLFTNEKEARQPSGSMQGREGEVDGRTPWPSLATTQFTIALSKAVANERRFQPRRPSPRSCRPTAPTEFLSLDCKIASSILWFFDSWGTLVFLLCDRCFFLFSPSPILPIFFSWGFCLVASHCSIVSSFRSLPFQAIHSFSSSRGIAKLVVVFYIELVKSSCFVWIREVVEFRVKLRGRPGFRLGFLRLVCVFFCLRRRRLSRGKWRPWLE